jgi:alpha-galactosidase
MAINRNNPPTTMKKSILTISFTTGAGAILLISAGCLSGRGQTSDELAMTPQMGWNSWNKFAARVNEQVIRETADAMATNGMKAAGYQYVCIDDTWEASQRDADGSLAVNTTKFPSGMKALADYVHSKGLKLGIYSDAGARTCAGFPASRDHEEQDARTFAAWGIDYLKYDWCNTQGLVSSNAYKKMGDALKASGRPILFSICEWGSTRPWLWAPAIGQSWRTTGDISARFEGGSRGSGGANKSVLTILDLQVPLRKYSGPGHWNDPDMLEVGNGMSLSEDRAHFTMWCMLDAPLITGNDLRNMKPETLKILTDKDVIAINQDPLGIQALRYSTNAGLEVWVKPLTKDAWAVCFLNRNRDPQKAAFDWKNEKVTDDLSNRDAKFDTVTYQIRDLWEKKDLGTTKTPLSADVQGHDVLLVRLDKK